MIIAIDPGVSGGIAWHNGREADVVKMPDTPQEILAAFQGMKSAMLQGDSNICAVFEKIAGYVPGNSGKSAVVFAMNRGYIEMALIACKIPCDPPRGVLPTTWQDAIGVPKFPLPKKEKNETPEQKKARKTIVARLKADRKRSIKDMMQRLYPHLTVNLGTADALGILTWKLQQHKQPVSTTDLF
jgi:hypothetical protein